MALLDIMLYLKGCFSVDLGIFHLNHMMRGEESDRDEDFLRHLVKDKGLEIFIRRYDFKKNLPSGESFENYARAIRYDLLSGVCSDNGYNKIATGHSMDDNIETVLMRIFSGTGIHGLSGISPKRGNIIRPLLVLSSEDIYEHLKENSIAWREDSSNRENEYKRNYIRNVLLPMISKRFVNSSNAINQLSKVSRDYIDIIDTLLENSYGELYTVHNHEILIDMENFSRYEKILKYILSKSIRVCYNYYVSSGMIDEIYRNSLSNRTNVLLYGNKNLIVRKTVLNRRRYIIISKRNLIDDDQTEDYACRIDTTSDSSKEIFIEEINLTVKMDYVKYDFFIKNFGKKDYVFVSLDRVIDNIIIRNKRDGDRIKLENGSKKIKDLMIDNKLDDNTKKRIPMLLIGSRIAAFMSGLVSNINGRVSPGFWVREDSKKILAIYRIEN